MPMHHDLPSGARVRLRLPFRGDEAALRALVGDEEAERLLRFDPRRRAVLCAADFDEIVGVGAIDLEPGADPDVLAVNGGHGKELEALIAEALVHRASRHRAPVRPRRGGLLRRARRRP
jgi:hypothetical protein